MFFMVISCGMLPTWKMRCRNYPGGTGLMSGAVFGRLAGAQAAGE
jgi:hypothetical protein